MYTAVPKSFFIYRCYTQNAGQIASPFASPLLALFPARPKGPRHGATCKPLEPLLGQENLADLDCNYPSLKIGWRISLQSSQVVASFTRSQWTNRTHLSKWQRRALNAWQAARRRELRVLRQLWEAWCGNWVKRLERRERIEDRVSVLKYGRLTTGATTRGGIGLS